MIPMRRLVPLLPLLLVLAFGCHGSSNTAAKVSGKVTYKGQVVPAGSVAFHAPEGGFYPYSLKEDGTYSGTDLPAGEMVVTIETESANPKRRSQDYGKGKEGANPSEYEKKMRDMGKVPSGPSNAGPYVEIPKKYAEKTSSTLKVTLNKGDNVHNFDLTD